MNQNDYCISCTERLNVLDLDPNGDRNCTCARCRAEEEHDFDREPNVKFTRGGKRMVPRQQRPE